MDFSNPKELCLSTNKMEGVSCRIPSLDGLRGVAVLLVMTFHLGGLKFQNHNVLAPFFRMSASGWVGVDLFFVLSGFLITSILLSQKNNPNRFLNFYFRRILRVFPLYFLVLVLMLIVFRDYPLCSLETWGVIKERQIWLWVFGSNLIRQDWAIFTHCWSLAIEEQFYLLWPIFTFYFSLNFIRRVSMALICFSFILRCVCVFMMMDPEFTYTFTFCRLDGLFVGTLIAAYFNQKNVNLTQTRRRVKQFAIITAAPIIAMLVKNHGSLWKNDPWVQTLGYSSIAGFFGCLFILVLTEPKGSLLSRGLNNGVLRTFGKYSYGLYLFHFILLRIFDEWFPGERFTEIFHSELLGSLARMWAFIFSMLVVAWISWNVFESPILKLKKHFEN